MAAAGTCWRRSICGIGRFGEAVTAYRNAIRLDGATAAREAGLGEAIAGAAGGHGDGRCAGRLRARAGARARHIPRRSFYLATALAQEGQIDEAVAAWQAMLAALPAGFALARRRRAGARRGRAARMAAPATTPRRARRRSRSTRRPACRPHDRNAMIETMVAGLDEKLRQNPHDPEGWTRLVRSYVVLGKTDAGARRAEARHRGARRRQRGGKALRRICRPRSA